MSLPEEYRTARYKSLPQGLMAEAEAIIKKKFGIKEEKKSVVKTIEKAVNGMNAKFIQEYTPIDMAHFYNDPRMMPVLRLVDVKYHSDMDAFLVRVQCRACGVVHTNSVTFDGRDGYTRAYTCKCGSDRYHTSEEEFRRAYHKAREVQYVPPGMYW